MAGKSESTKETETTKTKKSAKSTKSPNPTKVVPSEPQVVKRDSKSIVIAVLATILGCMVVVLMILMLTGVIKFGGAGEPAPAPHSTIEDGDPNGTKPGNVGLDDKTGTSPKIVENTYKRVRVDGNLAAVRDLEFYLPDDFEAAGKNSDGAYTYNLVDDDGWAQVLVYAEESSLTPEQYLLKRSPNLDITDKSYKMNGTTWVQGENASTLAYATKLEDTVYALIYSVKLESDDTAEAMMMIPKTLYMKRIYQ